MVAVGHIDTNLVWTGGLLNMDFGIIVLGLTKACGMVREMCDDPRTSKQWSSNKQNIVICVLIYSHYSLIWANCSHFLFHNSLDTGPASLPKSDKCCCTTDIGQSQKHHICVLLHTCGYLVFVMGESDCIIGHVEEQEGRK